MSIIDNFDFLYNRRKKKMQTVFLLIKLIDSKQHEHNTELHTDILSSRLLNYPSYEMVNRIM